MSDCFALKASVQKGAQRKKIYHSTNSRLETCEFYKSKTDYGSRTPKRASKGWQLAQQGRR